MFTRHVREQAEANARIYPGDAGLVKAVDDTMRLLNKLPDRFECEFHLDLKPDQLGSEPNEVFANLLLNLRAWVGYMLFTTAFKCRHLLSDLTRGLNEANYFLAMSVVRMVMEQTAVVDYHAGILRGNWEVVQQASAAMNQVKLVSALVNCLNLTRDYANLTRLNWRSYASGDYDTFFSSWTAVEPNLLQRNIITFIDKLPQEERGARFRYDLLSEYVHPNAGAHTLSISSATPVQANRFLYVLEYRPQTDESLQVVLHLLSSAVTGSLPLVRGHLQYLSELLTLLEDWANEAAKAAS